VFLKIGAIGSGIEKRRFTSKPSHARIHSPDHRSTTTIREMRRIIMMSSASAYRLFRTAFYLAMLMFLRKVIIVPDREATEGHRIAPHVE
jgi:hypothetical protein